MRSGKWLRLALFSIAVLGLWGRPSARAGTVNFNFDDAGSQITYTGTNGQQNNKNTPFLYVEPSSEGQIVANFQSANLLRVTSGPPPAYATGNASGMFLQQQNSAAVSLDIQFNAQLDGFSLNFAMDVPNNTRRADSITFTFLLGGVFVEDVVLTGNINAAFNRNGLAFSSPTASFDEVVVTTTGASGMLVLDNISVDAVPELSPGSAAAAATVLACALAMLRGRRSAASALA